MEETIKKILRRGVLHEREVGSIELTIEIFQQIEQLEYEGVSSDRENLRDDIRHIGEDLQTGIRECKRNYKLELV